MFYETLNRIQPNGTKTKLVAKLKQAAIVLFMEKLQFELDLFCLYINITSRVSQ